MSRFGRAVAWIMVCGVIALGMFGVVVAMDKAMSALMVAVSPAPKEPPE